MRLTPDPVLIFVTLSWPHPYLLWSRTSDAMQVSLLVSLSLSLSLLSGKYVSAGIQTHYLTILKNWAGQNMWISRQRLVCMTRMASIMSTSLVLLFVRVKRRFQQFSVISRHCLVVTGSSMLTFIVLRHWSIMPQTLDMIPHPVKLSWHCLDQS